MLLNPSRCEDVSLSDVSLNFFLGVIQVDVTLVSSEKFFFEYCHIMENQTGRKRNSKTAKIEDLKDYPPKLRKRDKNLEPLTTAELIRNYDAKVDKLPKAKLVEKYEHLQKVFGELQKNYDQNILNLNKQIKELQIKLEFKQNMSTVQTQTYPQSDVDFNCGVCVDQFTSEQDLWSHMDDEHDIQKQETTNKFMCECCEENFETISDLNYHMKEKHDSMTKSCDYFARGICHFSEQTCWYSHKKDKSNNDKIMNDLTCKHCGEKFSHKSDLMKHRKHNHENKIAICREYVKGKCQFGDDCWYKHEIENHKYQTSRKMNEIPEEEIDLMNFN